MTNIIPEWILNKAKAYNASRCWQVKAEIPARYGLEFIFVKSAYWFISAINKLKFQQCQLVTRIEPRNFRIAVFVHF